MLLSAFKVQKVVELFPLPPIPPIPMMVVVATVMVSPLDLYFRDPARTGSIFLLFMPTSEVHREPPA